MEIIAIMITIVGVLVLFYVVGIFIEQDEIAKGIIISVLGLVALCAVLFWLSKNTEQEQTTTEQATEQATEQPQWSDWQEAEDSFLLQEVEEDTYVVEQDDGTYVCKALTYSSTGETEETYKVIEKNDNITVKFLDLMEGEKPYGEVLERTSNDETQTMYVFHVPATEN